MAQPDIKLVLLQLIQDHGHDAKMRLIHPKAIGSNDFIVINNQLGKPSLGVYIFEGEVELCSLEPIPDCPEGFPKDHLGSFELADPVFPDNLMKAIAIENSLPV